MNEGAQPVFDYVIAGSGFGGSVSAMRLTEKGYSVLVLERGKRYRDEDFATSNWNVFKYIWAPALRCFGILQISPFRNVFVLHGSGVGGGSLGYANVLMQPAPEVFKASEWNYMVEWGQALARHYDTARRMLGVTRNPRMSEADLVMKSVATEMGVADTFHLTDVGAFFGEPGKEGQEVPDPFFGGEGPPRTGCTFCGGCMVGCRYNSKNTLTKNYLYLAEKWGAQVWPEREVRDVRPLPAGQADGARYEVIYRSSSAWLFKPEKRVRARNVIFSAGGLGTLRLLFRCRDITGSLSKISPCLGDVVRTNNEALLGTCARTTEKDYSKGLAITSIFQADPVTSVEPVRYPAGSSLMRFLSGPLVEEQGSVMSRLLRTVMQILLNPVDFLKTHLLPGWAQRTTILLVMQTEDTRIRLRPGRSIFTFFRSDLVSQPDNERSISGKIDIGHQITRSYASRVNGIPAGSINESLFDIPMTAHILGGCPLGRRAEEGVVDDKFEIHNYPGLYAVDGSIVPGNPGVNPSLTITALAEYAMSRVPPKPGAVVRKPIMVS